jgi:hypothetical protein
MPVVENVSLGGGQVAPLQSVVTLSAAQIIALPSPQIPIVPAPGAGKLILPKWMYLLYHFGTHPFVGTEITGIGVAYTGGADNQVALNLGGAIFGNASALSFTSGSVQSLGILPGVDNTGLVVTGVGSAYNVGPIVTATLGAGGTGYVANDTGTITNGANDATYKVLTVGAGGAVLTFQITSPGTVCNVANGNATVDGGAQPGVGAGFTVNITAVQTGDGTLKVVTYYQIIPVP